MSLARVRLVFRSCELRKTSTRVPESSGGTRKTRTTASGSTSTGRVATFHGRCSSVIDSSAAVMDLRTDTTIGEDFEEHGVLAPPVDDVHLLDAVGHGFQRALDLRDHAAADAAVANH